eukprot:11045479-Lingulodinium_polyedra.AAC.1
MSEVLDGGLRFHQEAAQQPTELDGMKLDGLHCEREAGQQLNESGDMKLDGLLLKGELTKMSE